MGYVLCARFAFNALQMRCHTITSSVIFSALHTSTIKISIKSQRASEQARDKERKEAFIKWLKTGFVDKIDMIFSFISHEKRKTNVILVSWQHFRADITKTVLLIIKIELHSLSFEWLPLEKISVKHTEAWWNCLHVFFGGIKRIRFKRKTKEKEGKTGSQNRIRVRVWSTVVSAYIVSWRWSW